MCPSVVWLRALFECVFFLTRVLSATHAWWVCVSFRPVSASSLNLLLGVQVWSIDPVVCGGPYPT